MFNKTTIINHPNKETIIRDGLGKEKLIKESAEFYKAMADDVKKSVLLSANLKNNLLEDLKIRIIQGGCFYGYEVLYEFKINDIIFNDSIKIDKEDVKRDRSKISESVRESIINKISGYLTNSLFATLDKFTIDILGLM